MIVSHAFGFVLVTPPKTASTSLHRFLSQPPFCASPWTSEKSDQHSADIPKGCADYLVITTWRHPLDREVSLWGHSQSQASRERDHIRPMTFAEFVHDFQPTAWPLYSWSQKRWRGGAEADVVLRFDSLYKDLMAARPVGKARGEGFNLKPLLHMNATDHPPPSRLYTPDLERIVLERFAEDLPCPLYASV